MYNGTSFIHTGLNTSKYWLAITWHFIRVYQHKSHNTWELFQFSIRCLIVRFRKDSRPRDLYLALPDRPKIWQAYRQQCCRVACQIWKRGDDLNYQSRSFETSRDLKIRHLGFDVLSLLWSTATIELTRHHWYCCVFRRNEFSPLAHWQWREMMENTNIFIFPQRKFN